METPIRSSTLAGPPPVVLTKLGMEARARLLFLLFHHRSCSSEQSNTATGRV